MIINFYDLPSNAVTGRIKISETSGQVSDISGDAHKYFNEWTKSGRDAASFAEYYNSWTNGHIRSEGEVATLDPTLAFTIDEDGTVLELVLSDAAGVFVREDGDWLAVNTDEDQPTIDDLEWLDVTEEAVAFFDEHNVSEKLTRADVEKYAAPSE